MSALALSSRPALPRRISQPWPGHQLDASNFWFCCSSSHTSLVVAVTNQILPSCSAAKLNGRTWGWSFTLVARYHAGTFVRYCRMVSLPVM